MIGLAPVSYIAPGEKTSPAYCRAFALGCGGRARTLNVLLPGDVSMFGSPKLWHLLMKAQKEGRNWYYGDHAYFGRGSHYKVTKNAYQHSGFGDTDSERFRSFCRPVQEWRRSGSHVLICPQTPTYFKLFGWDYDEWLYYVQATIRLATDRPIRVRRKNCGVPIAEDLKDCWAVVAYSSCAALDALLAGVPAFTLATFGCAYRMGTPDLTKIETPYYPEDRETFFAVLANNQWTLDEIRQGMAWRVLQQETGQ